MEEHHRFALRQKARKLVAAPRPLGLEINCPVCDIDPKVGFFLFEQLNVNVFNDPEWSLSVSLIFSIFALHFLLLHLMAFGCLITPPV